MTVCVCDRNTTICVWAEKEFSNCPRHLKSLATDVVVSFYLERLKWICHIPFFDKIPRLSRTMLVRKGRRCIKIHGRRRCMNNRNCLEWSVRVRHVPAMYVVCQ